MKHTENCQESATPQAVVPPSSIDVPAFSRRLRRIAALLEQEAERSVNGRLSAFFLQESERLRKLASVGAES